MRAVAGFCRHPRWHLSALSGQVRTKIDGSGLRSCAHYIEEESPTRCPSTSRTLSTRELSPRSNVCGIFCRGDGSKARISDEEGPSWQLRAPQGPRRASRPALNKRTNPAGISSTSRSFQERTLCVADLSQLATPLMIGSDVMASSESSASSESTASSAGSGNAATSGGSGSVRSSNEGQQGLDIPELVAKVLQPSLDIGSDDASDVGVTEDHLCGGIVLMGSPARALLNRRRRADTVAEAADADPPFCSMAEPRRPHQLLVHRIVRTCLSRSLDR